MRLKRKSPSVPIGISLSKRARLFGKSLRSRANANIDEGTSDDVSGPQRPSKIPVVHSDEEQDEDDVASRMGRPRNIPVVHSDEEQDEDGGASRMGRPSKIPVVHSDEEQDEDGGTSHVRRPSKIPVIHIDEEQDEDDGASNVRRPRNIPTLFSDDEDDEGGDVTSRQGARDGSSGYVGRLIEMEARGSGEAGDTEDEDADERDNDDDGWINDDPDDDESFHMRESPAISRDQGPKDSDDDMEEILRGIEASYENSLSKRRERLHGQRGLFGSVSLRTCVPATRDPEFQAASVLQLSEEEKAESVWMEYLSQLPTDYFDHRNLFVSRQNDSREKRALAGVGRLLSMLSQSTRKTISI